MVDDEKGKGKWAGWKAPEVGDALDDDLSEPVQFLNIKDLRPDEKAGDQPVIMPPVARDRPSVVIRSDVQGGNGTKVREMPVVKAAERGPISVVEKRKKEILNHLEADTPESRKKIAEIVLFNLRGLRTNLQLPPKDFESVTELDSAIKLLPILQGEEDYTVAVRVDTQGVSSSESIRPSKIVSIPLTGLKIAGRSAEINLDIKFVAGAFDAGNFAVVGVRASFDDQGGADVGGVASSGRPGFWEKLFGKKLQK